MGRALLLGQRPPAFAERVMTDIALADRLAVVHANHDDAERDPVGGQHFGDDTRPVEEIGPDETGIAPRPATNRDFRNVGQRVVDPLPQQFAERIADYVDKDRRLDLRFRRLRPAGDHGGRRAWNNRHRLDQRHRHRPPRPLDMGKAQAVLVLGKGCRPAADKDQHGNTLNRAYFR